MEDPLSNHAKAVSEIMFGFYPWIDAQISRIDTQHCRLRDHRYHFGTRHLW